MKVKLSGFDVLLVSVEDYDSPSFGKGGYVNVSLDWFVVILDLQ